MGSGMLTGVGRAASEIEADNNGEDFTRPVNRFDTRLQVQTLPKTSFGGELVDNRHQETITLRTDLVLFKKPDQIALRLDLPLEWSNKPTKQHPAGVNRFGVGDMLAQVAYIHTFNERWAAGFGLQVVMPTATEEGTGNGKWQLAPTLGARISLPEISQGSYLGLVVREYESVGGNHHRTDINYLKIEPQLNIALPDQWFVNSSPDLRYNFEDLGWFVPLDLMVGKRFGERWIASVEYQYGWVRTDDHYHQWVEARVGYFF